jgi:predicted HicB family RNase H-like nuclease
MEIMEIIPGEGSKKYMLRLPSAEFFDQLQALANEQGVSPNTLINRWASGAVEGSAMWVQLPKALHRELRARAKEQGIPLNSLVLALLAGSVGFKLAPE